MTQSDGPRSVFDEASRTEEEELYFDMIDRAIEDREYRIISNGKPGHAVYLIYKLFEAAQQEVKVLTGELARTLDGVLAWSDPKICEAAVEFLRNGGRLKILVENELDCGSEPHPFLAAIVSEGQEQQLTVAQVDKDAALKADFHHFLLMDKSALRVETDAEKAKAVVNFNDPDFGGKLSDAFDAWLMYSAKPLGKADWGLAR